MVEADQVRDIHKSMGPDKGVLRELANVTLRPLLIIFSQSWQLGDMLEDWRKANYFLHKRHEKEPRDLQTGQPHFSPWEGNGTANSGNHFQACEGHKYYQKDYVDLLSRSHI